MKTLVGIVLAVVLGAAAGAFGAVMTVNQAVATADKAASEADPADLGRPADFRMPS